MRNFQKSACEVVPARGIDPFQFALPESEMQSFFVKVLAGLSHWMFVVVFACV